MYVPFWKWRLRSFQMYLNSSSFSPSPLLSFLPSSSLRFLFPPLLSSLFSYVFSTFSSFLFLPPPPSLSLLSISSFPASLSFLSSLHPSPPFSFSLLSPTCYMHTEPNNSREIKRMMTMVAPQRKIVVGIHVSSLLFLLLLLLLLPFSSLSSSLSTILLVSSPDLIRCIYHFQYNACDSKSDLRWGWF